MTSSPGPLMRITDPEPAFARAAAAARADGAQLIIGLSHLGVLADLRLPEATVIVGGHSHTLLSNTEPGARGPHPTVSPTGALIVQAGAYGRYAGRLDLDLDGEGAILAFGGAVRHVGLELPEDPVVAVYGAPLQAARRRILTILPAPLGVEGCRRVRWARWWRGR